MMIATIFREDGKTGVHTHVRQLREYLSTAGVMSVLVTPFSWGRLLTYAVFSPRLVLMRVSGPASVVWYRYWHKVFLRNALRRRLASAADCVIYAQGPLEAEAALQARHGKNQRVVMAVHYKVSQADEWVTTLPTTIKPGGAVYRGIRRAEREVIPRVDGLVYVSEWARQAVLSWLPEAAAVPSAVIGNFVYPLPDRPARTQHADLVSTGGLNLVKNHRFLLEVLAEARRSGRSITLDIFGDGPLRQELLQLSGELGLEDQVRFRGFRSDVREFLPGYRAYVHSSYSETSSLAIIEAMAAGLPVVAGNIGPMSELFDDGAEGRFWPLDDPAAAADILISLLDDEQARLKAAAAAGDRFRRDFDARIIGPRLSSFLHETPAQ